MKTLSSDDDVLTQKCMMYFYAELNPKPYVHRYMNVCVRPRSGCTLPRAIKFANKIRYKPGPGYSTSTLIILISSNGLSTLLTLTFSIACTTSNPCTTRPKTVCLLSSQGVTTVVMKN